MGNTQSNLLDDNNNLQSKEYIYFFKEWLEKRVASQSPSEVVVEAILLEIIKWDTSWIKVLNLYPEKGISNHTLDEWGMNFTHRENKINDMLKEKGIDLYFWENKSCSFGEHIEELIKEWIVDYQASLTLEKLYQVKFKETERLEKKLESVKTKLTHWTNLVSKT